MTAGKARKVSASPRFSSILSVGLFVATVTIFFSLGVGVGLLNYFHAGLPSIAKMELEPPNLVTRVFARDSSLLAELYTERRVPVPLSSIPEDLKAALLAVEDRKFHSHWGVDIWGVIRAFYINQLTGRIQQGGSTITQQLARELFLTRERTYSRKVREAILAWEIERTYTKDEILERYFNQIYFGSGAWGIQEAARTYFSKDVSELELDECAVLAGLPNAPSRNSPLNNMENALERRNWVITCMQETGYLASGKADSLRALPIRLSDGRGRQWIAPYFVDYVRQLLLRDYAEEDLYRLGLQIYTTLDARMQKTAEQALENHLRTIEAGRIRAFNHPTRESVIGKGLHTDGEQVNMPYLQGSMVVLDPHDGDILVMIGGRSYWESKFNRAVQALRQPGSSFKPFVYTAAIDNGIPACQVVEDSPISIPQADGTVWRPSNYTNDFLGPVTLRNALTRSINLVAIKTLMNVGAETVAAYARRMGITTRIPAYESIAVGSADVYQIEITSAYTAFPNLGVRLGPRAIREIRDSRGNLVRAFSPDRDEVLSPQTAYIVLSMLRDALDRGTGQSARQAGFTAPAGGKTGTTNDYTDAWFNGFTPDLVASVWVGFDRPKRIIGSGTGSLLALPIWTQFMKTVYDSLQVPVRDFDSPAEGLTTRLICRASGKLSTRFCPSSMVYTEIFRVGTEPSENESCYVHKPSIYF